MDVAQAGGTTLNVGAQEFSLSPATLTAPANTSFSVTLTNNGGIQHNFTIDAPGADPTTGNAQPGGTSSNTFNLPDGTY
ncbi:MAG: hypothetical protein ACR2OD_09005, partial [Gaiellaceae bacterium]